MNRVQNFRSTVAGARPVPGSRGPGEFWVNFVDGVLGYIDEAGDPIDLKTSAVTCADVAPATPKAGDLWFDTTGLALYVWYEDADSAQWVVTINQGAGGATTAAGDAPPANPEPGTLWFDTVGGQLYVRYDDGSSQQWVIAVNATQDLTAYAEWAGGTFTGDVFVEGGVQVGSATSAAGFLGLLSQINGETGISASRTGGLTRWNMYLGDATPESGGNAGAAFRLEACDDAGVVLSDPLTISRVDAIATFSAMVKATGFGTRLGLTGAYDGNWFNIDWSMTAPGVATLWINDSPIGPLLMRSDLDELQDQINALKDELAALRPQPRGAR